jgi:hypothetical protein
MLTCLKTAPPATTITRANAGLDAPKPFRLEELPPAAPFQDRLYQGAFIRFAQRIRRIKELG